MVTIQDVAKAAGVSPMTVSHVINEHRHVKESTRSRVLVAMTDLGYRVNVAARNLRTGRTNTIGLAVPEIDRPYCLPITARRRRSGRSRPPRAEDPVAHHHELVCRLQRSPQMQGVVERAGTESGECLPGR